MNVKDTDRVVPLPIRREAEACASCGEEFACGAELAGCWCSEVKLDDATRAELRERFRGCLCRACLEAYAARVARRGTA